MKWILRRLFGVLALACLAVLVLPAICDAQVVCGPNGCYRVRPNSVRYMPARTAAMAYSAAYAPRPAAYAPPVQYAPQASYGYSAPAPQYSYAVPTYSGYGATYGAASCSGPSSYSAPPVQYDAPIQYDPPMQSSYPIFTTPLTYGAPSCSGPKTAYGGGGYGGYAAVDYSYGY